MRRKKKGSSLVLVMIFAFFFTVISSVVVLAVVDTTKSNSTQEIWEDNYYVAEAAIETAVVKASKNEFDILKQQPLNGIYDPSKTYEITYDEGRAFDGTSSFTNKEVDVKVIKSGDKNATSTAYINEYYVIEVIAKDTNKGQVRKVTATIAKRMGTGDIFKYMICGDEVYIESGATMGGKVNSANQDPDFTGGPTNIYEPSSKVSFTIPDFNFPKMTTSSEFKDISSGATAFQQIENLANDTGSNGVLKFSIPSKNDYGVNTGGAEVYLINSDELTIETTTLELSRKIIITSGNVNLKYGTLNLSFSTIIGKRVVSGPSGSTTMNIPPTGSPGSPFGSESLKELNKEIALHCNNWDVSGGSSGSSNYWDTVKYR